MRLVTFTHQGSTRIGVVMDGAIADICVTAPEIPREMIAFLNDAAKAMERARKAASNAPKIPLAEVKLEPPVLHPPEFLAIGLNYAGHVAETGREKPSFPLFFNKQSSCINGPY